MSDGIAKDIPFRMAIYCQIFYKQYNCFNKKRTFKELKYVSRKNIKILFGRDERLFSSSNGNPKINKNITVRHLNVLTVAF